MKLVDQLIYLLRERGVLSGDQLLRLAERGFIEDEWETHDDLATRLDAEYDEARSKKKRPIWEDVDEPDLPPRRAGRGKARAVPVLPPEELCARLAERMPGWDEPLRPLVALAAALGPCVSWRAAAETLRRAEPADLVEVLAEALRCRAIEVGALWRLLCFDDHRRDLEELPGTAGHAYRALLSGAELTGLGKFAALLAFDEAATVYALVAALRVVQRTAGLLMRRAPTLFVPRGEACPEAATLLLLLAIARQLADSTVEADAACATVALPTGSVAWSKVWALALALEPESASPLFVRCLRVPLIAFDADAVPPDVLLLALRHQPYWMAPELAPSPWLPDAALRPLRERRPLLLDWEEAPSQEGSTSAWARAVREMKRHAHKSRADLLALLTALGHPLPEVKARASWAFAAVGGAAAAEEVLTLVSLLADPDAQKRLYVIETLGHIGPRAAAATSALAHILATDVTSNVRAAAATALGKAGSLAATVTALARALGDPSPLVRNAASNALRWRGPAAALAVPALLGACADEQPSLRAEALRVLGWIDADAYAVADLLQGLAFGDVAAQRAAWERWHRRDPEGRHRCLTALTVALDIPRLVPHAVVVLGRLGKPAVPALIRALALLDFYVVELAKDELELVGNNAIPDLIDALAHPLARVRDAAAAVLARRHNPIVVNALIERLLRPEPELRRAVVMALGRQTVEPATVLEALRRALHDLEPTVRRQAALALFDGRFTNRDLARMFDGEPPSVRVEILDCLVKHERVGVWMIPLLVGSLSVADKAQRGAAAAALGALGSDAAEAAGAVAALLGDAQPKVRVAAAQALGRLGCSHTIAALRGALEDTDEAVRFAAQEALRLLNDRRGV